MAAGSTSRTGKPKSSSSSSSSSSKRSNGKVGQACIFCRRSHMTCDAGRPCQRCIKRDIGHLCRDEKTAKGGGGGGDAGGDGRKGVGAAKSRSDSRSVKSARRDSKLGDMSSHSPAHSTPAQPHVPFNQPAPLISAPQTSAPLPASAILNALAGGLGGSAQAGASRPDPMMGAAPSVQALQGGGAHTFGNSMPSAGDGTGGGMRMPFGDMYQANDALQQAAAAAGAVPNLSAAATNSWVASMLGGASFLGLGGGDPIGSGNGLSASGDAAGGNEYNILSEFLESLDGGGGTSGLATPSGATTTFNVDGTSSSNMSAAQSQRVSRSTAEASNGNDDSGANNVGAQANHSLARNRRASVIDTQSVGNNKTETFLLTAADQKDGTRDERLGRVIQAKLDAGLLRPYNHVKGYARLNQWMEQNCSQISRRRILKPLSIFRPAFRAVAQRLTNVDLIFIEEAFERLLLDYDRLFSTQGIPACLWRRTGEIYKGNKEFADLVGVDFDALRDGNLTIYELMQEESAVNYWEKYGAVCFDPGQKAVLTSCVLKTSGNGKKRSSAAAAARSGVQTPASNVVGPSAGAPTTTAGTAPASTTQSSKATTPTPTPAADSVAKQTAMSRANSTQTPSKKRARDKQNAKETSANVVAEDTSASTTAATTPAATVAAAAAKDDGETLSCCFSFTIRRDAWGIPYAIVGNFLPLMR